MGRPGLGALPSPTARPLGRLPEPTTHWLWPRGGAGVGTRHQPHSARSCELALRAVGAARGRLGGGASCLGVGRPGSGAHPPPTARPHCGLPGPTTHWLWVRGGAGVGTRHKPHSARSCELALRAVGAVWGCPGGHLLPGCGASGVGRSPIPDCPPSGRASGAHYPLAVGAGVCGRGDPSQTPQRALLRAGFARCGGGMSLPGGAPLALVWGVRGRALSHPRLPALWAGCRGPLPTGCGCRGVRARGPVTNPTARALASWLCALWGRHAGARGGRLLPGCGASGIGRSPTPDCPPSGRAAGAHYRLAVGAGGCGRGDPSPTPQRALLQAGFARCGGGMRMPGGAPRAWVWGVRGRALSHPRLPALWAGCWGPLPTGCWCGGGAGVGTHHKRHSARSFGLASRAVGADEGVRGGAPPAWVWGVRGRALSYPRLPALWAGCWGPLPTGCGCGGVRA